jgi:WD40 repeat protein
MEFWPSNPDYTEAIQNPQVCFKDAELRQGQVALSGRGTPLLWTGNFAAVYRMECPTTQQVWAVKCFTRRVPGLQQRYQAVSAHLQRAQRKFLVESQFVEQGILVKGKWYPILKMRWVEGAGLNDFLKNQLGKPALLDTLSRLWIRLAQELRDCDTAHADLQHGNVLLIPGPSAGSVRLRLVDYDGMFVPGLPPGASSEGGHPNFQHPQRLREGTYNAEIDRFSHLVIYVAFRAVRACGRTLWDRYDNDENMLFRENDFQSPETSPLMRELWQSGNAESRALAGHLILACKAPIEQTPLLSDLVGDGSRQPSLTPEQRLRVQSILGLPESSDLPQAAEASPRLAAIDMSPIPFADEPPAETPKPGKKTQPPALPANLNKTLLAEAIEVSGSVKFEPIGETTPPRRLAPKDSNPEKSDSAAKTKFLWFATGGGVAVLLAALIGLIFGLSGRKPVATNVPTPVPLVQTPVVPIAPPPPEPPAGPVVEDAKLLTKNALANTNWLFQLRGKQPNGRPIRFFYRQTTKTEASPWREASGDRVTLKAPQPGPWILEFAAADALAGNTGGPGLPPGLNISPGGFPPQQGFGPGAGPAPADFSSPQVLKVIYDVRANKYSDWEEVVAFPLGKSTEASPALSSGGALILTAGAGFKPKLCRASDGGVVAEFEPPPRELGFTGGGGPGMARLEPGGNPFDLGAPAPGGLSTFYELFPGARNFKGPIPNNPFPGPTPGPQPILGKGNMNQGEIRAVAMSPSGAFAAASFPNGVQVWHARDRRHFASLDREECFESWSLTFSADDEWLAGATSRGSLWVWSLKDKRFVHPEGMPNDGDPAGIGRSMPARPPLGDSPFVAPGFDGTVRHVSFASNGSLLCTTSGGILRTIQPPNWGVPTAEVGLPGNVVAASPSGSLVAAASFGKISLIDSANRTVRGEIKDGEGVGGAPFGVRPGFPIGQPLTPPVPKSPNAFQSFDGPVGACEAMAFNHDGSLLAASLGNGQVGIYSTSDGELLHSFAAHSGPIRALTWSKIGNTILSLGIDAKAKVWRGPFDPSAPSPVEIASIRYEGGDGPVVGRSATAAVIAAPSSDPMMLQFRMESGSWLEAPEGRAGLGPLKSESTLVQLRAVRGTVQLPDTALRLSAEINPFANWTSLFDAPFLMEQPVTSLTSSDDGKLIAGDEGGNLRCWGKGELSWEKPKAHKGPVHAIAMHRGRKAASCGKDKLILWDIDKSQTNASFDLTAYGGGVCVAYLPTGGFVDPLDTFGRQRVLSNAVVCGTAKGAWLSANEHKGPLAASRNPHSKGIVWAKVLERGVEPPHILTAAGEGIRVRTIFDRVGDLVQLTNEPLTLVDAANGRVAVASDSGRRMVLLDGRTSKTLVLPQGKLRSLALTANGEILAAGADTGALTFWRTSDGKLLEGTRKFKGPIAIVLWRGSKLYVAAGNEVHVLGESKGRD